MRIRHISCVGNTTIPPDRTSGKRIVGIPIWKQKIRKLRVESKELFWKNTRFFYRIINWYTKETTNIRTTGAIPICLVFDTFTKFIYTKVSHKKDSKDTNLEQNKMTTKFKEVRECRSLQQSCLLQDDHHPQVPLLHRSPGRNQNRSLQRNRLHPQMRMDWDPTWRHP